MVIAVAKIMNIIRHVYHGVFYNRKEKKNTVFGKYFSEDWIVLSFIP